jgi:hypothetical protein
MFKKIFGGPDNSNIEPVEIIHKSETAEEPQSDSTTIIHPPLMMTHNIL